MAAPIYDMTRGWFIYNSDDGNQYIIGTTVENGFINGSSPTTAHAKPTYPRGWVPRKVYGHFIDSGKVYRTHVPCVTPTVTLFLGTTNTFTKGGQSFTVDGRIGERRTDKGG